MVSYLYWSRFLSQAHTICTNRFCNEPFPDLNVNNLQELESWKATH